MPTSRPPLPDPPPEHISVGVEKDQHDARARLFRQSPVFVAIGLGVERAVEDQDRRVRPGGGAKEEPLYRLGAEDGGGFVLVRGVRAAGEVDVVQAVAGVDDVVDGEAGGELWDSCGDGFGERGLAGSWFFLVRVKDQSSGGNE